MKAAALVTVLLLFVGPWDSTNSDEPYRAKLRVQIATVGSSASYTIILALEEGTEKFFDDEFPQLRVLVLPLESEQVPLQISLIAESGQILSSTIVYYTPELGAEFSLDAAGVHAQGQTSSLSR